MLSHTASGRLPSVSAAVLSARFEPGWQQAWASCQSPWHPASVQMRWQQDYSQQDPDGPGQSQRDQCPVTSALRMLHLVPPPAVCCESDRSPDGRCDCSGMLGSGLHAVVAGGVAR